MPAHCEHTGHPIVLRLSVRKTGLSSRPVTLPIDSHVLGSQFSTVPSSRSCLSAKDLEGGGGSGGGEGTTVTSSYCGGLADTELPTACVGQVYIV